MPGESRMHLQQPSQWAGGGGGTFARSGGFGARGPEGDGFQPAHRGGSAVGSGSTGRRGGHEMMALAGGERGYEQVVGMGAAGLGTNVGSDMTGSSRATQRVSDPGGQTAVWGGSGMQHSDIWGGGMGGLCRKKKPWAGRHQNTVRTTWHVCHRKLGPKARRNVRPSCRESSSAWKGMSWINGPSCKANFACTRKRSDAHDAAALANTRTHASVQRESERARERQGDKETERLRQRERQRETKIQREREKLLFTWCCSRLFLLHLALK